MSGKRKSFLAHENDPLDPELRIGHYTELFHKVLNYNTLFFDLLSRARPVKGFIVIPRSEKTDSAFRDLIKLCGAEQIRQDRLKFRTTEELFSAEKAINDLYGEGEKPYEQKTEGDPLQSGDPGGGNNQKGKKEGAGS